MTALAKPRLISERHGRKRRLLVAASTVVWQGAMVTLTGVGAAAKLTPATLATGLRIIGVAVSTGDNRIAQSDPVYAEYEAGVFLLNNDAGDPITVADIGAACYVTDDNTVSKTSASNTKSQAGTVFDVDSSGVWVKVG